MKRALLALSLLVCSAASAQMADPTILIKSYAAKVLPRCPGGSLELETIPANAGGPTGFRVYRATIRSTDQYCGTQKFLIHSPKTDQVIFGSLLALPEDSRPATVRITEQASKVLGHKVVTTISPFPIQDGLKTVAITRETAFGPFVYHGFVDPSEKFLIVGSRGNLRNDPAQTIREVLGTATAAARKGNAKSKVEILEFSDFQCPTCARAHEKVDPIIQKNLSKVNYGRLDLPLFEHHEWAVQAAMAARSIQRVAPAKYWAFVDYVFKNQEAIGKQKFDEFFKNYVEDHDMNWSAIQKIYTSKSERAALLDQVSKAFTFGIAATPTYIVNGQLMGFGPDGSYTVDAIKAAMGVK